MESIYCIRGATTVASDFPNDVDEAVRELLECDGPAFLDVATDPGENVFPMVPAGASLDSIITGKEMSF